MKISESLRNTGRYIGAGLVAATMIAGLAAPSAMADDTVAPPTVSGGTLTVDSGNVYTLTHATDRKLCGSSTCLL